MHEIDRYHNISLSLKNVMSVMFVEMFVIAQLVLGGVFCGNQSNCRICILIGECWNGVESLETLELVEFEELPGMGWKVHGDDWNVRNVPGMSGKTGMSGMSLEQLE